MAAVPDLTAQAFSAMLHECIGQNKLSASRVPRITEKATECLGVRLAWWRQALTDAGARGARQDDAGRACARPAATQARVALPV